MPATITINLQMSYRCRVHQDVELEAFQPTNGVCTMGACIKCQQEQDSLHNDQITIIRSLQERLVKSEKAKKLPKIYINSKKIKFKKGGKK